MNKNNLDNENKIDLRIFFNIFIRNKSIIILISILGSILNFSINTLKNPIWEGDFQILVKKKFSKSSPSPKLSMITTNKFDISQNEKELRTLEYLLKSPSILDPIYKSVLNGKQIKSNISFYDWKKNHLEVAFVENTNVLLVKYKDKNQKDIIDNLNLISKEYQKYSKKERQENLVRAIDYLSKQKQILEVKSKDSLKELNSFSIEYGLGDLDGFVALGTNGSKFNLSIEDISQNDLSELTNRLVENIQDSNSSNAGQRFKNQFNLLEQYETQYTNLSSKLKPNTRVLKNLKIRIDNLRESLKRPNEILIKYRDLKNIAQRDESLLNNVNNNLNILNLEKVRYQDPWEIISKPNINKKIFPKKNRDVLVSFLCLFILSYFCLFIYEKITGIIYEFDELKNIINYQYFGRLYAKNINYSNKVIANLIKNKTKNSIENYQIGLVSLSNNKNSVKKIFMNNNEKYKYLDVLNIDDINMCSSLIIIVEMKNLKYKDLSLFLNYLIHYKKIVTGWYLLDFEKSF